MCLRIQRRDLWRNSVAKSTAASTRMDRIRTNGSSGKPGSAHWLAQRASRLDTIR